MSIVIWMKYDLVVISGETLDSCPCVGLSFQDKIYMFNIPDQTQRVYRENKIRFSKLAHIFLTNLSGRALGGFHGLLITVFQIGVTVNFTAPKGFESVFESYKHLHTFEELRPKIIEDFSDDNISVNVIEMKMTNSYEVKLRDIPGKFLIEKARALGLKSGPIFSDLQHGKTVTLDDGRVITPDQVLAAPTPGELLFVVDCLCPEDVAMIPDTTRYDFVVHFTKYDMLMLPEYLAKFDPNVRCLCFNPSGRSTFSSISALYAESMKIAPDIFLPLVVFKEQGQVPEKFVEAVPKLEYQFAPPEKKKFHFPKEEPLVESPPRELPKFDTFGITFLGTGGMFPSKYRNVTGILIHTHSGYVLLDSGEGSTGQLRRVFGPDGANHILKNLLCIFITHLHGDHHFGLYQLLQTRAQICEHSVPLICHSYLSDHMHNFEKLTGSLKFKQYDYDPPFKAGLVTVTAIPVDHCFESRGCTVDVDGGYRIAFSGDRSVNDNFAKLVGQCDLLIHEATFTDDLLDKALKKHHSTISQAIQTGKDAHAHYVILTHFSQRYPKLPVFGNESSNIAFACDYLTFGFEQIDRLCQVCPQIFQMIADLEAKDDNDE